MRKAWLAGILVALLVAGCARLPKPNFDPPGPAFRVVTYNVHYQLLDPKRVAKYLAASRADVICLQETNEAWEIFLADAIGTQYPYAYFEHAPLAGGIAFMSRTELRHVIAMPSPDDGFPAVRAEADTPIGPVQLLNVHLRPRLTDRDESPELTGLWNSPAYHRREMTEFTRELRSDLPVIVAGDFNEREDGGGIGFLKERGFVNALSLFDRSTSTWSWRIFWLLGIAQRYDHVLFRGLHCTGCRVDVIKASDHEPVIAVMQAQR